ncbi:hypothetical protein MMYC01_201726 [Madurella mycetomatis]|uniref:Uncharacterized protein n=1 Tax=Madurella mycetomatis TaxID=100816 RepID=A0A175WCR0_9PEZI|nr:hypothetical protein MMYC01_205149 [Madurella mycetomatis]KXX81486.1 hypothetical protein MMYC01_201726 [Madurella mycetomatis]
MLGRVDRLRSSRVGRVPGVRGRNKRREEQQQRQQYQTYSESRPSYRRSSIARSTSSQLERDGIRHGLGQGRRGAAVTGEEQNPTPQNDFSWPTVLLSSPFMADLEPAAPVSPNSPPQRQDHPSLLTADAADFNMPISMCDFPDMLSMFPDAGSHPGGPTTATTAAVARGSKGDSPVTPAATAIADPLDIGSAGTGRNGLAAGVSSPASVRQQTQGNSDVRRGAGMLPTPVGLGTPVELGSGESIPGSARRGPNAATSAGTLSPIASRTDDDEDGTGNRDNLGSRTPSISEHRVPPRGRETQGRPTHLAQSGPHAVQPHSIQPLMHVAYQLEPYVSRPSSQRDLYTSLSLVKSGLWELQALADHYRLGSHSGQPTNGARQRSSTTRAAIMACVVADQVVQLLAASSTLALGGREYANSVGSDDAGSPTLLEDNPSSGGKRPSGAGSAGVSTSPDGAHHAHGFGGTGNNVRRSGSGIVIPTLPSSPTLPLGFVGVGMGIGGGSGGFQMVEEDDRRTMQVAIVQRQTKRGLGIVRQLRASSMFSMPAVDEEESDSTGGGQRSPGEGSANVSCRDSRDDCRTRKRPSVTGGPMSSMLDSVERRLAMLTDMLQKHGDSFL